MNSAMHLKLKQVKGARFIVARLKVKGFTLIENVVAMVLMGLAMITLITLLYPFVQRAAEAQMEARAASLSQSVMNTLLSYSFDEASDHSGDLNRCDENDEDGVFVSCSTTLGADAESNAAEFDDIDDFIGCWYTGSLQKSNCAGITPSYELKLLMGNAEVTSYNDFRVIIDIDYFDDGSGSATHKIKEVEVSVDTLVFESVDVTLKAFRGNY